MGRSIQERLFDGSLDSSLVKAADEFVDLMDEQDELKKRLSTAQGALILEMNKGHRLKIKHQGRIFEIVSSDPKQKIRVKKEKSGKKKRSIDSAPLEQSAPPVTPPKSEPKKAGKARSSKFVDPKLKLHKQKK